ncbi:MAG: hypothetical protein GC162_13210 [Planctomycetes bacterium]|nr:hypothetical protein [Planctomycetota bacterium]
MKRFSIIVTLFCLAGCANDSLTLRDIDGHDQQPLSSTGVAALIFISADCPISNALAPTLVHLHDDFAPRGVRFYLIHCDPAITAERAHVHAAEYHLDHAGAIMFDRDQMLVRAVGASVTPQAVLLSDGDIVYRGRVNDLFADLGVRRTAPTREDLRLAIEEVLNHEPVAEPRTIAIGCDIPSLSTELYK